MACLFFSGKANLVRFELFTKPGIVISSLPLQEDFFFWRFLIHFIKITKKILISGGKYVTL